MCAKQNRRVDTLWQFDSITRSRRIMTERKCHSRSGWTKTSGKTMRYQPKRLFGKIILSLAVFTLVQACSPLTPTPEPTLTPPTQENSPTITLQLTETPSVEISASPDEANPTLPLAVDSHYVLSLADNGYQHLFIYSPQAIPLYRITNGTWDDITPAISPDGTQIAFSSRRNGYFDIYIMDLETGET